MLVSPCEQFLSYLAPSAYTIDNLVFSSNRINFKFIPFSAFEFELIDIPVLCSFR